MPVFGVADQFSPPSVDFQMPWMLRVLLATSPYRVFGEDWHLVSSIRPESVLGGIVDAVKEAPPLVE